MMVFLLSCDIMYDDERGGKKYNNVVLFCFKAVQLMVFKPSLHESFAPIEYPLA